MARCTTLCDKVCQWLAAGRWFSPRTPVSSTNKTDHRDITEILLKAALNTIKQKPIKWWQNLFLWVGELQVIYWPNKLLKQFYCKSTQGILYKITLKKQDTKSTQKLKKYIIWNHKIIVYQIHVYTNKYGMKSISHIDRKNTFIK